VVTHPTHPLPTGLGISVGSAVLVQLTIVSVRHRDHATFVAIGRIFAVRVCGSDAALNYLSVALPMCVAVTTNARLDVNVALNRPSYQSSTYAIIGRTFGPHLANDGNTNPDFGHWSCMSTWAESNPWYAVDLGMKLHVRGIKFTNRDLLCCRTYTQTVLRAV